MGNRDHHVHLDDHEGHRMTMLEGTSEGDVDAPLERCWEVVEAIDRSPEWQQGMESVSVLERDAQNRPSICEIVVDAKFSKLKLHVSVAYDPPHRLTFAKLGSGSVDQLEGSWELSEAGPGRTHARYTLALDPGKVGLMARPLEKALRPVVVGRRPSELAAEVSRRAAG
jgi:ribosome-associated toxin RatA of RatAB toxin-antitoxin module